MSKPRDAAWITLLVIALVFEIALLFHSLRWIEIPFLSRGNSQKEAIGSLLVRQSDVKRRQSGALSWQTLAQGDELYWEDSILTGADSSAKIQVESGEFEIGPDTLLKLTPPDSANPEDPLVVEVSQGKVRIRTFQRPVQLRIQEKTVAIAPQSETALTQPSFQQTTQVIVEKGSAQLQTQPSTPAVPLEVGKTFEITPNRTVAAVLPPITLEAASPNHGQVFLAETEALEMTWQWKENQAQFLELATKENFQDKQRFEVKGTTFSKSIEPGKYFWRLAGKAPASPALQFEVIAPANYQLISPKFIRLPKPIELRWTTGTQTATSHVQVSKDADFKQILYDKALTEARTRLKLPAGKYFWRVQGEHSSGQRFPASTPKSFSILPPMKSPKLKGVRILPDQSKRRVAPRFASLGLGPLFAANLQSAEKIPAKTRELRLEFEWEPVEAAETYLLQVAEDEAFHQILKEVATEAPSLQITLPRREIYYWRVRPRDAKGIPGPASKSQKIEVPTPRPPEPKVAQPEPPPSAARPEISWERVSSFGLRFGNRGGFNYQRAQASDYSVTASGYPLTQYWAKVFLGWGETLFESFVHYREDYYDPPPQFVGIQRPLNQSYFEAELLARHLWTWHGLPFSVGLFADRGPNLTRLAAEQARLADLYRVGFVVGPTFRHHSPFGQWETDALFKLLPAGQSRGVLLSLRSRWQFLPNYTGTHQFSPEIQLYSDIGWTWVAPDNRSQLAIQVGLALAVGWEFERWRARS